MMQPPPLILISLESYRPELVNLANVKDVMSLKRHQGHHPARSNPIEGRKESEFAEGLLTLAVFQAGQPENGQNCGLPFDLGDSRWPFPPRARAAAR
jgi:hypothetical protein